MAVGRWWTGIMRKSTCMQRRIGRLAKGMEKPLYQGRAWHIAEELKTLARQHRRVAKELRQEAGYFESHQRRMQYLEMREEGYPIGSGMVESGCKQFRAR